MMRARKNESVWFGLEFHVTSAIPGRIRLKVWGGSATQLQQLADGILAAFPGTEAHISHAASSITLTYTPGDRDLNIFVREIERTAAQYLDISCATATASRPLIKPSESHSRPAAHSRFGWSESNVLTETIHAFPGRVRLRDTRLRRHPDITPSLHKELSKLNGLHTIEIHSDDGEIILHFDTDRHTPGSLADHVAGRIHTLVNRPAAYAQVKESRDLEKEERGAPNPLIAATAAVALASVEGVPIVILGGALALASLPIIIRAAKGIKSGCVITEQLDLITIGTLALRGEYIAGGLMTWLIGLTDMLRGRVGLQAAHAVEPVVGASRLVQPDEDTSKGLVERVKNSPLSNTRAQNASRETNNKLAIPLAISAAAKLLGTQDVLSGIGIIKPRCEFEAGSERILPTTVLSALSGAAREGVVFAGGRSLEKLATANTLVVSSSAISRVQIRTIEELLDRLVERGFRRFVLPEVTGVSLNGDRSMVETSRSNEHKTIRELRRAGYSVLFVTDNLNEEADRKDADTSILLGGVRKIDNPYADVLIRRAADLPKAIDLARESDQILKRNTRILAGAATVNLFAGILGIGPPPLSTLVVAAATATAATNALKPLSSFHTDF